MPCRSDYMEPNAKEQANRRAAKLLVWAKTKLGKSVPEYAKKAAADAYGKGGDRATPELCAVLRAMQPGRRDAFLRDNCVTAEGRDLMDWWQAHEQSDAAREPELYGDDASDVGGIQRKGGRIIR